MNKVQILGPDGTPFRQSRPAMLTSGGRVPYDAADSFSDQLANWQPALWSPDNEINIYRDRIVARARDLVRNDGWASGAVTRLLDNAVGANFRPIMKPDYRVLRMLTGKKTFDSTWAEEYGKALEAHWRTWAYDTGRYCDAERKLTVPQMLRLAFRHKLIDGDRGDDDIYQALLELRESFVTTMGTTSQGLVDLVEFSSGASLPALVLANRLYQDAGRAGELIAATSVPHPAFMPTKMKVLRK